ncbi:hypothetical protein STIUS_v1c04790 [Spiroplasma sp. TIUS-1]|uniref:hypothetical protein n=1 Tax=Spiroplasma sp. TIUS-1 TaxID=216963 RepID=UPI00139970A1|nr:hypothetical protein [Spiroplasma sp. TIUS-1]QHX36033.1 hypothetical protein STIUS_v1c04790 [Spiroplasma sp. TIUS-1]
MPNSTNNLNDQIIVDQFKQINSQSIYWGFPVCLISTHNPDNYEQNVSVYSSFFVYKNIVSVATTLESLTYKNLTMSDRAILNVPSHAMVPLIKELSKKTHTPKEKKKIIDNSRFKYVESDKFKNLIVFKDSELVLELSVLKIINYENNNFVTINFMINKVSANENIIDKNGIINSKKISPINIKFREYYKLDKKPL